MLPPATTCSKNGRSAVAGNFFTSLGGPKRLCNVAPSFDGTIRDSKKCVPIEMRKSTSRPAHSSLFGFHDNLVSLCSYVSKKE